MADLLSLLWGTFAEPGHFLSVNAQEQRKTGILTQWYPMATAIKDINDDIADLQKHHAWFGVCSRRADLGHHARGGEHDIVGVPAVWIDFDYLADTASHASEQLPTRVAVEQFIAQGGLLTPTAIVDSGYGYHCYWALNEPWTFAPGMASGAKHLLQAFQAHVRRLAAFHVDHTADPPRMMRLPGTNNWKVPEAPKPVTLLWQSEARYSREQLATWSGATVASQVPVTIDKSDDLDALVNAPENDLLPFDKAEVLLALGRTEKNKALMRRILSGRPLAERGMRDVETNKAVSQVAFTARVALGMRTTVDDVFDILEPSYVAMATDGEQNAENPPPTENRVRKQIATALGDANAAAIRQAKEEAQAERFMARLRGGRGPYTDEEVERFAKDAGEEDFEKLWIIANQGHYWTFVNGAYNVRPWPKDNLITALRQDLAAAPIMWDRVTATGGTVPKQANEIVDEYGTVVRGVRMSLVAQTSYLDRAAEDFVLATAPLAKIEPKFHPMIDRWLCLLGGAQADILLDWIASVTMLSLPSSAIQADILLDWIASVTMLSLPSSAIYLRGPGGAGKTMLATGLARLWASRQFTPFEDTIKFNYSIASRPFIFADESTPRSTETSITGLLRRYIANRLHRIEEKFLPRVMLEGCVRVLLCANNDDLLSDGNEHNTREDIEAIAQRIVHIPVTDAPGAFLRSLGGLSGTADWVDGDMIAAHALWLRDNRQVNKGMRFLNEGTRTDFHVGMMSQGDRSSIIVEALLRSFAKTTPGVIVGQGRALVNAQQLYDAWDSVSGGAQPPKTVHAVGRVLAKYARDQVTLRIGATRSRYWIIDTSMVLPHGEKNGFDVSVIEKRLQGDLPADLQAELIRNEKALTRLED